MAILVFLLLLAAFILALMAAFGVASKVGLHALAFALFVLAELIGHASVFTTGTIHL